uniref:Wsv064-like protein n=1 Tax=Sicyonia whispovirus TaxID=2984283 RepID=A0A9C7C730_9VIRU|nr:MAG: wsv064-like protein [Sicyonia whispovirus]
MSCSGVQIKRLLNAEYGRDDAQSPRSEDFPRLQNKRAKRGLASNLAHAEFEMKLGAVPDSLSASRRRASPLLASVLLQLAQDPGNVAQMEVDGVSVVEHLAACRGSLQSIYEETKEDDGFVRASMLVGTFKLFFDKKSKWAAFDVPGENVTKENSGRLSVSTSSSASGSCSGSGSNERRDAMASPTKVTSRADFLASVRKIERRWVMLDDFLERTLESTTAIIRPLVSRVAMAMRDWLMKLLLSAARAHSLTAPTLGDSLGIADVRFCLSAVNDLNAGEFCEMIERGLFRVSTPRVGGGGLDVQLHVLSNNEVSLTDWQAQLGCRATAGPWKPKTYSCPYSPLGLSFKNSHRVRSFKKAVIGTLLRIVWAWSGEEVAAALDKDVRGPDGNPTTFSAENRADDLLALLERVKEPQTFVRLLRAWNANDEVLAQLVSRTARTAQHEYERALEGTQLKSSCSSSSGGGSGSGVTQILLRYAMVLSAFVGALTASGNAQRHLDILVDAIEDALFMKRGLDDKEFLGAAIQALKLIEKELPVERVKELARLCTGTRYGGRRHASWAVFTCVLETWPWLLDTYFDMQGNTLLALCIINLYPFMDSILWSSHSAKEKLNVETRDGLTPLMLAVDRASSDILTLLNHGADAWHINANHETVLHCAAASNNTFALRTLFIHSKTVGRMDELQRLVELRRKDDGVTAAMLASVRDNADAALVLASVYGARLDTRFGRSKWLTTPEAALLKRRKATLEMMAKRDLVPSPEVIRKSFEDGSLLEEEPLVASAGIFNYGRPSAFVKKNYESLDPSLRAKRRCQSWEGNKKGNRFSVSLSDLTWALFNKKNPHVDKQTWVSWMLLNDQSEFNRTISELNKYLDFNQDACSICLDGWKGRSSVLTTCGHRFHLTCWDAYCQTDTLKCSCSGKKFPCCRKMCPCCRTMAFLTDKNRHVRTYYEPPPVDTACASVPRVSMMRRGCLFSFLVNGAWVKEEDLP